MKKFLKNITDSVITAGGKEIAAGTFWELTNENLYKLAFNVKTLDYINNDQILLSLDGTTTLTKQESLDLIRTIDFAKNIVFDNSSNGFNSKTVQAAIEEINLTPVGTLDTFTFFDNGGGSNKWLDYAGSAIPSDKVPVILPFDAKLIACTFANAKSSVELNIEVHRAIQNDGDNATQIVTFEIRDTKVARFSNFTPVQFNAGDKIGVYIDDEGTNPNDPVVKLYFLIDNYNKENASEDYSGGLNINIGGISIDLGL